MVWTGNGAVSPKARNYSTFFDELLNNFYDIKKKINKHIIGFKKCYIGQFV